MSLLSNLDEFDKKGQVGDWCFTTDERYLVVKLHEGNDGVAAIRIKEDPEIPNGAVWQWDGNREAPTLTPSILHHSNPEWHGYLREGQLILA